MGISCLDRPPTAHGHAVATLVERYPAHLISQQENAAAAGPFEVFGCERVGQAVWVEADAFILDLDDELVATGFEADVDHLGRVALVPVADRVDDRLLEGQPDAEQIPLGISERGEGVDNDVDTAGDLG